VPLARRVTLESRAAFFFPGGHPSGVPRQLSAHAAVDTRGRPARAQPMQHGTGSGGFIQARDTPACAWRAGRARPGGRCWNTAAIPKSIELPVSEILQHRDAAEPARGCGAASL